jgi:hypothetical protein
MRKRAPRRRIASSGRGLFVVGAIFFGGCAGRLDGGWGWVEGWGDLLAAGTGGEFLGFGLNLWLARFGGAPFFSFAVCVR